ncbi:MAG: hypothetical protein Q8Q06_02650 [bacterium]|nr:hypothetical protein [bacterium]
MSRHPDYPNEELGQDIEDTLAKIKEVQLKIVRRLLRDFKADHSRKWLQSNEGFELIMNDKPLIKIILLPHAYVSRTEIDRVCLIIKHNNESIEITEPTRIGWLRKLVRYEKKDCALGEALRELSEEVSKEASKRPSEENELKMLSATYNFLLETDPYPTVDFIPQEENEE